MNIITVIPLVRSKITKDLSYFTAADIPVGAIVTVPLRSKMVHGIVTKSRSAADLKSDIRNADFEIKKLSKVRSTAFFPRSFIEAAAELAEYYATTLGAVIDTLVPEVLLSNIQKIVPPLPAQASFDIEHQNLKSDGRPSRVRSESERIFAVQGDDADRLSSWRSLIRQEFARKRSLAIYVPTIEDCDQIYTALEKGIEGYIFKLNSDLTKKKILSNWAAISETEHPVVIVATGTFSLLPRNDIESIVIERENGRGWITPRLPYLDLRQALQVIAKKRRQTVFLADSLLRVETLHRIAAGEIDHGSPFKWRSISDARDILVSMISTSKKRTPGEPDKDDDFKILSPELEDLIRVANETSTQLFIMTLRRGLATTTVCADCESIVACHNCAAPVVLHTSPENGRNFFMCHKCGERRSADETCATCGSWRLTPLGIGLDRVASEIHNKFPGIEIFRIDADSTKTETEINETMKKFRERPGSILLGTELALLRLSDRVDHIAVVSLDSLFALPDFKITEKIMYTLVRLRSQATRSILVQTRRPEEKVFEYGLKGNLSDFYRLTLAERKQFAYPPFNVLIKITIEGKKDAIADQMSAIQKLIGTREIDIFPAFTSSVRGNSFIHGLIRIEEHAWPDPELVAILRALPPTVTIKINPETLL